MAKEFEVRWEGELPGTPQEVWDAFTVHTDGWLWKIEYEPRAGGAERGLTSGGGTVTVWDPPRHFVTRARRSAAKPPCADASGASAVAEDVAAGDLVRLTPAGLEPIDGVVDYATHAFLGVPGADALYRFYGRHAWGWPVGVAHHLFAGGADKAAGEHAWSTWLDGVFVTEAVA